MSDELKLYGPRDHFAQGQHYIKHVMAMTEEGLHRKSDIAAELAHRDIQIEALRAAVASTLADLRVARSAQQAAQPVALDDALWGSKEVMSLNAEMGLTMGQIVKFARAVLKAAQPQQAADIEDFRLRCIDLVAFHGGSVEIEAAIRNLSAAAPKGE